MLTLFYGKCGELIVFGQKFGKLARAKTYVYHRQTISCKLLHYNMIWVQTKIIGTIHNKNIFVDIKNIGMMI